MFKKSLFYLVWLVVMLLVIIMSTLYRDGREAMVAEVESRVAAISLPVTAKVDSIYVVPGQSVQKGQPLIKISRPDLDLDMRKAQYGLQLARMDSNRQQLRFSSDISQLDLTYETENLSLQAKKEELLTRLQRVEAAQEALQNLSGSTKDQVGTLQVQLNSLKLESAQLKKNWKEEKQQMKILHHTTMQLLTIQIKEEQLKLQEINQQQSQLIQYSPFDGTVGPVNVELQENTASYVKLLSVYESSPSLIKAFTKENRSATLQVGQKVTVMSTNRSYEILGVIESMGSRVTSYPSKINPNPAGPSYGQEVFIRISPENNFLKGEKVYVYAMEE